MFPLNDLLDSILVGSFLFGLVFAILTLLLGFADIGLHGDHGDGGHDAFGGDILGGLFNLSSILAFITWFGGIGYLARRGADFYAPVAVLLGLVGGFLAALAVTWFMVRVLRPTGKELNPADYEEVGVIARVSSSIRSGGVGEIVYEQAGTRHVGAAKAELGVAIPRGTEVIVLKIERGVAIVDTVENLMDSRYPA